MILGPAACASHYAPVPRYAAFIGIRAEKTLDGSAFWYRLIPDIWYLAVVALIRISESDSRL